MNLVYKYLIILQLFSNIDYLKSSFTRFDVNLHIALHTSCKINIEVIFSIF